MVIAIAYGSYRLLIRLYDQVCGIFMLSGTFRTDHIVFFEDISTLSAVDRMPVHPCQGICQVFLIPTSIAAILWLPVYDISNNAEGFLFHQWQVISSCASPGGYSR